MYKIAVLTGLYSYSIFVLGLIGGLSGNFISIVTAVYLCSLVWVARNSEKANVSKWVRSLDIFEKAIIFIVGILATINLLGVFAPELSFDSLWYHLTLPKIYLSEGWISYIHGSLFYYSAMPKLIDLLFVPGIYFGDETLAKFIHFLFGIGCLFAIYSLARKLVERKYALLAILIFYSNLVVAWLSTTSFIDLGRTFFETLSFIYFVDFVQMKKESALYKSGVVLGLAIATKLLALFALATFVPLVLFTSKSIIKTIKFSMVALLVALPWFLFSYFATGNPVFPFLSDTYKTPIEINFANLLGFVHSPDPVSPIYLVFLPLVIVFFKKFSKTERLLIYYTVILFVLWFILQTAGTGRYLVSSLPVYSVLCVIALIKVKDKYISQLLIVTILIVSFITIGYRFFASIKYIPVVFGYESKDEFLEKHLNFSYGDFYDVDSYFSKNIKLNDRVLIYNIHNLYYVNFPFVESTYLTKDDYYNYVLVRGELPKKFKEWKLVYENDKTNVKLYKKP